MITQEENIFDLLGKGSAVYHSAILTSFTFDPYYSPNVSNGFMEDFKNNGGKYRTYIQAQPPYYWYYEVKDTNIPKFLKFKEADSFALRTILPTSPTPSPSTYTAPALTLPSFLQLSLVNSKT